MIRNLLSTALLTLSLSVSAQAAELSAWSPQPEDHPTSLAMQNFLLQAKDIDGHHDLKILPMSAAGDQNKLIRSLQSGDINVAVLTASTVTKLVPKAKVLQLPFLFRDIAHFRKTMYGPQGDKILAAFDKAGFVALCMYESGARSVYAKKPVKTVADMKGMKIRVQPSDLWVSLISALGASPTPMPMAEVYTGLKTGLVDAAENNYPSYDEAKHYESAPVYSETMHVMSPEVVVFSKKVWENLTKEEQAAIRKAAKDSIPFYTKLWEAKETSSKAAVIKGGAKVIPANEIDHAGFVAAEKPVWDKFANTPELKALVQDIVNTK